ncbi:hypothetical protein DFH09DRAFT_1310478 [Mycena vulgaris]|nr:hypothetical protein DFH09DRAFT_1310478 [Mycena vulgaris]
MALGFGIVDAIVALPSIYPIDAFDRRPLMLWTLPFMKLFLLMMGFAFWIENLTTRVAIAFTYSAGLVTHLNRMRA